MLFRSADPGADRRDAGRNLQALGGPTVGRQLNAGVFLLALLDVSELAIVGASILVRLADLEQRGAQAEALPVVFDPGLDLPGYGRRQDFRIVGGKPRRCATQDRPLL